MTSMISIILTIVLYISGGGSGPSRVDVVRLESRDSSLFIRFSEPINKEKAETAIKVSKGSVPISGSITFADDNQAAVFTCTTLPVNETLNITITTDLADEFGSQLPGEFSQDFINTGADINIYDRAAPMVTEIRKIGPEFYITFNEEMTSTTTTGAVELTSAQGIFTGDCAADPEDAKTIRFTPGKALSIDVEYTVKVKSNTAADISGKGMSEEFSRSFLNEGKDLFIYEKPNPNEHETSRVNNNCLFQGSIYHPELGLYYFRSRFYSPVLGRFLQPDPMGYQDSFNLYEAFNNNPLNYVDPYGMSSKKHGINPLVSRSAYSKLLKYYQSKGMSGDAASDQALSDLVKYGYIEDKSELKLGIAVTAGTGFFYNAMHYVTLPLFELSPAGIFKDAVSLPFGKDLVYGTKLKWWNYAMVGVPILYETFKIGRGLGLADEFLDLGDYMTKAANRGVISRWSKITTPWKRNVFQRSDIDWDFIRPDGLTNWQAARKGYTPMRLNPSSGKLEDVVLHHLNQNARGSVVELWRSTHGKLSHKMDPPGSWRKIRFDWKKAWENEQSAYWRWRTGAYNPKPTDKLYLPGD